MYYKYLNTDNRIRTGVFRVEVGNNNHYIISVIIHYYNYNKLNEFQYYDILKFN